VLCVVEAGGRRGKETAQRVGGKAVSSIYFNRFIVIIS